ncbi:MAG: MFS transporter [Lactococcus lactis]
MYGGCMSIVLILVMNFLMAISTTIGMTITPFLITDSLGYSMLVLGLIEGITELFSNCLKLVNGYIFDKIKDKKKLFIFSTGIALFSKSILVLPFSWTVVASKSLERISNGAFSSPRDAFIADKGGKNKGFILGLLGFSKSAGCIIGPIVVSLSTLFIGELKYNIKYLILLCVLLTIPTFLCSFFINIKSIKKDLDFKLGELSLVLKSIRPVLILSFLFFLGRFNDGLLMMFLRSNGFPEWFYLSTISVFNGMMLISSPFIGSRIDSGKVKSMAICVIASMIAFQAVYSSLVGVNWVLAILGLLLWGIQRGGSQIVFSYMIFSRVDKSHYGTSIGMYYLVTGIASLIASAFCGYLATFSINSVFGFSFVSSVICMLYFLKIYGKIKK